MNERLLHTPDGVRDIYEAEYKEKKALTDKLFSIVKENGYDPIETPTFEYFDIFSRGAGQTPSKELYKFDDREGRTLVLRPDFTPAVARTVSNYFKETDKVRLCYNGNVYRNNNNLQGRMKESTQLGAEIFGESNIESDAEMIALSVKLLKASGLSRFIIGISHADLVRELTDYNDYKSYNDPKELEDSLKDNAKYDSIKNALDYLSKLDDKLKSFKVDGFVAYEPGISGNYNYYTGILFSGYTFGTGEPIIKGGRYDDIMTYFGKNMPALGFAVEIDNLLMALNNVRNDNYLTVALGKGRLSKKAMEFFKECGIPCDEMDEPGTRKLIFTNEEKKYRFFLSKGPDVPTYVEYGAADIGIVGADTIYEENRNVYEVTDLLFGKCRMCICGPAEAKELLNSGKQIRVATKYPHIAKDYFYNVKQQTVEIIKLNGSIELAPIVGLSDVICDIVETGSTLKENGLVVLEEVKDLSARMIVNTVSMQMENKRITALIDDFNKSVNSDK